MTADNPGDFIRPPNDNAYEADELRTGPPLDYVAEKFRNNLEALHRLIYDIQNRVPEDLSVGQLPAETTASVRDDFLLPFSPSRLSIGCRRVSRSEEHARFGERQRPQQPFVILCAGRVQGLARSNRPGRFGYGMIMR